MMYHFHNKIQTLIIIFFAPSSPISLVHSLTNETDWISNLQILNWKEVFSHISFLSRIHHPIPPLRCRFSLSINFPSTQQQDKRERECELKSFWFSRADASSTSLSSRHLLSLGGDKEENLTYYRAHKTSIQRENLHEYIRQRKKVLPPKNKTSKIHLFINIISPIFHSFPPPAHHFHWVGSQVASSLLPPYSFWH